MKGTSILLDRLAGRDVAALVVDGRLDDLFVAPAPALGPPPGTIFRGRVEQPIKGLGGAFVRLPEGQRGFLRNAAGTAGRTALVQVSGYAEPGKAVPLTPRILFKSRYVIVTPGAPGVNISRQIRGDARRTALMEIAAAQALDEGTGVIIRSSAADADDRQIAEDLAVMAELAAKVTRDDTGPEALLLDGPLPHDLAWREWESADEVDRAPGCLSARGMLEAIAALGDPIEPLPSGASLIVEPTRALIACDVNTGPDQSPAAGLKANIAAIRALPRALRLRGLGGQVVVDLAPFPKKDRRTVEQTLRTALRADRVETSLVGWTPLGHLELNRKRERPPLDAAFLRGLQ